MFRNRIGVRTGGRVKSDLNRFNCFNLQPKRSLWQPIPIYSKGGIRTFQWVNGFLKGLLWFNGGLFVLGGIGYGMGSYFLSKHQKIPLSIPMNTTFYVRNGLYYEEYDNDDNSAAEFYIMALNNMAKKRGVAVENERKPTILPQHVFEAQSKSFKDFYVDILIRLSLCRLTTDEFDDGYDFLKIAIILSKDGKFGGPSCLARGYQKLANIEPDRYLTKEMTFKAIDLLNKRKKNNHVEFVPTDDKELNPNENKYILQFYSRLTPDYYETLTNIGILFSREKDPISAIEVFLSLLRCMRYDKTFAKEDGRQTYFAHDDENLMIYYISQNLWLLGHKEEAINWCLTSAKGASYLSKRKPKAAKLAIDAYTTLSVMLEQTGQLKLRDEALETRDRIRVPEISGLLDQFH